MQEVGKQHTKAALVNDLLFVSTFFVCRLLCGPVVVYRTLRCGSSHRVVKWGGAGIQCVSFFWFYRIVQARMLAWPRLHAECFCTLVCMSSAHRLYAGWCTEGQSRQEW